MANFILLTLAAACYAAGAIQLKLKAHNNSRQLLLPVVATCLLAGGLLSSAQHAISNFHIGIAGAVFILFTMIWLIVFDFRFKFRRTWLLLLALATCTSIAAMLPLPGHPLQVSAGSLISHVLPAALSYACFTVAMSQFIDVYIASNAIHHATSTNESPLLLMEKLAFKTFYIAFGVLTITLVSGLIWSYLNTEQSLTFTHKNLFALLTWVCSLALISGRAIWGWRGKTSLTWISIISAFLLLSYLGSSIVIDIIINKWPNHTAA